MGYVVSLGPESDLCCSRFRQVEVDDRNKGEEGTTRGETW